MEFFDQLRVVDLTQVWIGPLVTRVLSNLGAALRDMSAGEGAPAADPHAGH